MSWLQKLLPPRIKRGDGSPRKAVPEGLWSKCESCEAVLYRTDRDGTIEVMGRADGTFTVRTHPPTTRRPR